jgi:putative transcriptional regulator|tara:strand:+ start:3005 stop:3538 length:534 start_codon:yes stop_codon:yes gene_type:complete
MDLTGKFLIARPNVVDPFFKRGVIFVFEHSPRGVAGLVINRKRSNHSTHSLLKSRGFSTKATPVEPLYVGGPVNEQAVVMLHTNDWRSSNTLKVSNWYSVTSDDMMIFKYTNGDTPGGYKFCSGSAVWHPQQIKAEIQANHWLISDLPPELIFEADVRELWDLSVEINARDTIDRFI